MDITLDEKNRVDGDLHEEVLYNTNNADANVIEYYVETGREYQIFPIEGGAQCHESINEYF